MPVVIRSGFLSHVLFDHLFSFQLGAYYEVWFQPSGLSSVWIRSPRAYGDPHLWCLYRQAAWNWWQITAIAPIESIEERRFDSVSVMPWPPALSWDFDIQVHRAMVRLGSLPREIDRYYHVRRRFYSRASRQ